MKANELRIGNWINSPSTDPIMPIKGNFQVEAWHLVAMIEFEKTAKRWIDWRPISLNMEWIVRLGFTNKTEDQYGNWNFWNKEKDASIDVDLTVSSVHIEPLFYYRVHETMRRKPLQYVHKLQNIHFELKGEELEFKQ